MGFNKELKDSIDEIMDQSHETYEFQRRFTNIIKNAIDDNYIEKDLIDLIELVTIDMEG